jgi:signal transduction histidine kinase/CheY-like chemotaxis protein/tetratricopeptide (TPR) repeat protein
MLRRYRLLETLSGPDSAQVVRAQDLARPDLPLVAKLAPIGDPVRVARIVSEARTLAGLDHPSVARLVDFGRDLAASSWVLVLEAAPGRPLDACPFDPASALQVLAGVARALATIHARGLLHLDLKPDNLHFDPATGRVTLLDFDLAGRARDAQGRGTAAFSAPEVMGGAGEVGPWSDLYALGSTLAWWAGVRRSSATVALEPLRLPEGSADWLAHLVARLTDPDPGRRPASARRLLELLAEEDPELPPETPATRAAVLRHPPFVGRQTAMAALLAAIPARRQRSRTPVALVRASAGLGRSRLLAEATLFWREQGAHVILVRPDPGPVPTLGAVRDLFRAAGLETAAEAKSVSGDPETRLARFDRETTAFLKSLGQERTVILFEDIHRYDLPSREFLLHLLRRVVHETWERDGRAPVELVLSEDRDCYREDGLKAHLEAEIEAATIARIELQPLDAGGTAALLTGMVAPEEVPADLPARLHEITGGNPLFIRETISNRALRADGGGTLLGALATEELDPSAGMASLEMVARGRLQGCSAAERAVLRALAAFPTGAEAAVVAAMLPAGAAAEPLLLGLARRDLVVATGKRWLLPDVFTRAAVLAGLGPSKRVALHARAVRALEASGGRPEEVAYQRLKGGEVARGADGILAAVPALLHDGQEEESVRLLEELIRDPGAPPFARRRAALILFDLRLARGQVRRLSPLLEAAHPARIGRDVPVDLRRARLHVREGQWRLAYDEFLRCARDEVHFTPLERLELSVEAFEATVAAGQVGDAREALADILAGAPASWPLAAFTERCFDAQNPRPRFPWPEEHPSVLARFLRAWADLARITRDHALALALWVAVTKIQGRLGNVAALGCALHGMATVELARGNHAEAERRFRAALRAREMAGDLLGLAESANNFGVLLRTTGRPAQSLEQFAFALRLLRQVGYLAGEIFLEINIANVHLERRELVAARRHLRRALQVARRLGDRRSEALILNNFGVVFDLQDRLGRAMACYGEAEALDRLVGNMGAALIRRLNRAGVAVRAGLFGRASRWIESVRRVARRRKDRALRRQAALARARLDLAAGREPRAALRLGRLLRAAGPSGANLRREVLLEASELAEVLPGAESLREEILAVPPGDEPELRARLAIARARMLVLAGLEGQAQQEVPALIEASRFARTAGLGSLELAAESVRAEVWIRSGRLAEGQDALQKAVVAWERVLRAIGTERLVRGYLRTRPVRRLLDALQQLGAAVGGPRAEELPAAAQELASNVRSRIFDLGVAVAEGQPPGQDATGLLRRLVALSERLRSTAPLEDLLRGVVEAAIDFSRAERGFLLTADDRGRLQVQVALTRTKEAIPSPDQEISQRIAREVLNLGRSVRVSNALAESRWASQASVVNLDLRSILCVPLLRAGSVSGLLYLDNRSRSGQFGPRDLELLEVFAAQAAVALDNARLARQFARDEKIRVLGNLAGGVAHDFNNLLAVILGRVEDLLARGLVDPAVKRELALVAKAARDGAAVVRRLQEFSRVRTGARAERVRLLEIVQDVAEFTRVRIRQESMRAGQPIQLEMEVPPDLWLEGDPSELREVFTNLVLNAVAALPMGGTISIRGERRGDRLEVVVEDTGVGMSEAVRENLFDPYFTTRPRDGVGLGMSIVLGILLRHRGTVQVDSAPGQGTRIHLDLPAAEPPARARAQPELPPAPGGAEPATPRGRVVVVDDEESIRELLAALVARAGYEVVSAASGAEALEHLRAGGVVGLLTDLGMVPVTGFDLAEEARRLDPTTAVVLVTGWGAEIDASAARARGVDLILPKPFELEAVPDALRRAIANRLAMAREEGTRTVRPR